jgi:hypothetical protein
MKHCAMWFAKQAGLCMGRHARYLGWCLLVASSLVWFGCNQLGPRREDQTTTGHKPPPEPEAPLEILTPPRPLPAPPKEIIDTQAPMTSILGQLGENQAEQDPDQPATDRPKLLPPEGELILQLPPPHSRS